MKVLITRPRAQSAAFAEALQMAGFAPVFFPVIEIHPVGNFDELDAALSNTDRYAWAVFTSVNAVDIVFQRLERMATGEAPGSGHMKIAAIGPKTATALRERGLEPHFVPGVFVGEAVLPGLGDLHGKRVLLPRAEIARKALPEAIVAAGGIAHEIIVYHTLPAEVAADGLAALEAGMDWITFTSPSTVQNFAQIARQNGLDPLNLPARPRIACIGPITEEMAREEGFDVTVVAPEYTTEGLIRSISAFSRGIYAE